MPERDLLEFERIGGIVIDTAMRQSSIAGCLWQDASNVQVESELASDSETEPHPAKNRYTKFVSRFERTSATAHRLSEEQVRSLTELFILIGKIHKDVRTESRLHAAPRLNGSTQAPSSPIRRSATLPSNSLTQYSRVDNVGDTRRPANARRPAYVSTLERIDSMADDSPPSAKGAARSIRRESSIPSPRALHRAKSTVSSKLAFEMDQ